MSSSAEKWIAIILFLLLPARAAEPEIPVQAMRLLHANCLSCHNPEKHKGGLVMTSRDGLIEGGDSGPAIDAQHADQSLFLKVLAPDADPHMPPKKQLSTNHIQTLRAWVASGAVWNQAALDKASLPRTVKVEPAAQPFQAVLAVALSPDSSRLAIARRNEIFLYDLSATNQPLVAQVAAHPDPVQSLAFHPDGKLLASGAYRQLKVWSVDDLKPAWSAKGELKGSLSALRFTPLGGALVAADSSAAEFGHIRVFNAETGAEISQWQAHTDAIYDLAVSPDGGFVASAGGDKVAKTWELVSQKEVALIEAHASSVWGVALGTNTAELVTVGGDKQLRLWDLRTKQSAVTINRKSSFGAVAWSADGKTVIAGDDRGALYRFTDFKKHTGEQSSETANERRVGSFDSPIQTVAISADGARFVAGTHAGVAYLTDRDGKLLRKFEPASQPLPPAPEAPSFVRDVLPRLARAGCMAGGCHAKPEGQNGFKLSVFSFDPRSDYEEIVEEGRGRRIFPAAPAESLLLLKATMSIDHGGGQRFEPGSDTYNTLLSWIRAGAPFQHTNEAALARITVTPREGIYAKNSSLQLRVEALYSDGAKRDVTHLADFVSTEKETARVDESGQVAIGSIESECVIIARYMGQVDISRITIPAQKTLPEERYAALPANNYIDRLAYAQFKKLGLFPSDLCSDAEFIRRSTLDAIGMLPPADEVREFLANRDPGKRRRWIEHLLDHPAYADYWANKWADLLRPNSDRVGVKSVFFLDQYLRDAFRENKPYDQLVREIVTAEGSNHENGPLTIYRDRREPPELTTIFSQLFLGVRMECAKCHHHPTEKWTQEDFYQLAAYFGPVKQKGAGLSPPISAGTESFYFAAGNSVKHPVTDAVMKPRALDAPSEVADDKGDPRESLGDWMTSPANPFFAKAAVNRIWAGYFGRGFVEPVDDFRTSNPISNEPLLAALAEDFVRHGYDLKHVMRTIMNSRVYQLSSEPNEHNLHDTKNFARSYRRRLPAEVLLDAVNDVAQTEDQFNGCPPGTRAIQTWSYKVNSHFMDAFGRPNPSSDPPCEREARSSVVQSLHMMNSRALQAKLSNPEGRVKKLVDAKLPPEQLIAELYLAAFSRYPSADEIEAAKAAYAAPKATPQTAAEDILWALLNSPEFVFNH